jgi:hypothetical protein
MRRERFQSSLFVVFGKRWIPHRFDPLFALIDDVPGDLQASHLFG